MSVSDPTELLRIGDVATRIGAAPRTIRYYEEIGLLVAAATARPAPTASTTRPTSTACATSCA